MFNRSLYSAFIIRQYYLFFLTIILLALFPFTSTAIYNRKTTRIKNSPIYYIAAPLINRSMMSQTYTGHPLSISQFYKLPIQFLSNAKPVDIFTGTSTKTMKKKVITNAINGYKKNSSISKLIYLPLKYLSNAKPYKVLVNSI